MSTMATLTHIEKTTDAFKVLSDPTRFHILMILFDNPGFCVNDIAEEVGISHSAASHQLAKLEAKGIVNRCREGRTMCYEVSKSPVTAKLAQAMRIFT